MKKIFFNLLGGKGHNIGLTCDFAEASYIGIRADNLEPRTYFENPGDVFPNWRWNLRVGRCHSAGQQNRCGGLVK